MSCEIRAWNNDERPVVEGNLIHSILPRSVDASDDGETATRDSHFRQNVIVDLQSTLHDFARRRGADIAATATLNRAGAEFFRHITVGEGSCDPQALALQLSTQQCLDRFAASLLQEFVARHYLPCAALVRHATMQRGDATRPPRSVAVVVRAPPCAPSLSAASDHRVFAYDEQCRVLSVGVHDVMRFDKALDDGELLELRQGCELDSLQEEVVDDSDLVAKMVRECVAGRVASVQDHIEARLDRSQLERQRLVDIATASIPAFGAPNFRLHKTLEQVMQQ